MRYFELTFDRVAVVYTLLSHSSKNKHCLFIVSLGEPGNKPMHIARITLSLLFVVVDWYPLFTEGTN